MQAEQLFNLINNDKDKTIEAAELLALNQHLGMLCSYQLWDMLVLQLGTGLYVTLEAMFGFGFSFSGLTLSPDVYSQLLTRYNLDKDTTLDAQEFAALLQV